MSELHDGVYRAGHRVLDESDVPKHKNFWRRIYKLIDEWKFQKEYITKLEALIDADVEKTRAADSQFLKDELLLNEEHDNVEHFRVATSDEVAPGKFRVGRGGQQ